MVKKSTDTKNRSGLINSGGRRFGFRSMAMVALFIALIGIYFVSRGHAASSSLSVIPASSNVALGSTFTVTIRENSGIDTVNAVQADLTYPATKLQFNSIDVTSSAFSVQATNTGGAGTISIARGTSTPVSGDQIVAVVSFTAIGTGAANVAFAASSAVLSSVTNTNLLTITNPGVYTVADATAPSVPTGLTSPTKGLTNINLAWTASTDNVAVTGYKVYRNGTQVGTSASTTYNDTGLTPGTAYSYTISAYDAAGNNSAQSTALSVTTTPDTSAPSVPTAITSPSKTMTSINLAWTASTDNVAVTGYKVFRNAVQVGTSATATYVDSGLTPGATYSYTVSAYDFANNNSAQSIAASIATLPDTVAPSTPTGLAIPSKTKNSANLSWTASTDNVAVTGYKIYRNAVQVGTSATNSYTDTALSIGVAYTYTVAAYDAAGNTSVQSTSVTTTLFLPGDVNSDTKVNIYDLSILLSNYGKPGGAAQGDIDGNGIVDILDLSTLLTNWTG